MKARVLISKTVILSGALTFSMLALAADSIAVTGTITDAACGAKHMMKGKNAAECTRACVKAGSEFALVSGKEVYMLQGDKAELDKYAGEKVTVKGKRNGNILIVDSVEQAKAGKMY